MMTDIRIDPLTNDIDISSFDIGLIENQDDLEQLIRTRLFMFQGEWAFDTSAGVPWMEDVLGKPSSAQEATSPIKDEILSIPGVRELLEFSAEYTPSTRNVIIRFTVSTDHGQLHLEETI